MKESGTEVTTKECEILQKMVAHGGAMSSAHLAREFGQTRQTLNEQLNDLEQKGLVKAIEENSNPKLYECVIEVHRMPKVWEKSDISKGDILKMRYHKVEIKFPVLDTADSIENIPTDGKFSPNNWEGFNGCMDLESNYRTSNEVSYTLGDDFLMVRVSDIFVPASKEGVSLAVLEGFELARAVRDKLEAEHDYLETGEGKPVVCDRHFAFEGHPNALVLDRLDLGGTLLASQSYELVVDKSRELAEAEVEGSDSKRVAERIASSLEYQAQQSLPDKIDELENKLEKLTSEVQELQD